MYRALGVFLLVLSVAHGAAVDSTANSATSSTTNSVDSSTDNSADSTTAIASDNSADGTTVATVDNSVDGTVAVDNSTAGPTVNCDENSSRYDSRLNLCVPFEIYGKMAVRNYGMLMARSLDDNDTATLPVYRIERASAKEFRLIFPNSVETLSCPSGMQVDPNKLRCTSVKKVICYITNWSRYHIGFLPRHIPEDLCTHVMYSFFTLNDDGEVRVSDWYADVSRMGIAEAVAKRGKGSIEKIIMTVGGWTYSGPSKGKWYDVDSGKEHLNSRAFRDIWHRMLGDQASRRRFIDSLIYLSEMFDIDGIELDYEYPACPWNNCASSYTSQRENFILLLRELREQAGEEYHISVAVSASSTTLSKGPSIADMKSLVDYFSVMTYDYSVYGKGAKSAHNQDKRRVKTTIEYFTSKLQVDPSKILLGVSMYGRGYKVSEEDYRLSIAENKFHGRQSIAGSPVMENSQQEGIALAKELCSIRACSGGSGNHEKKLYNATAAVSAEPTRLGNTDSLVSCRRSYFNEASGGSWLLFDQNMVSYTDVLDMNILAKIFNENNLGGYLVYAIDQDDYDGSCKLRGGSFPFLRYLRSTLDHIDESRDNLLWKGEDDAGNDDDDNETSTTTPPTTTPPPTINNCVDAEKCTADGLSANKCDCSKYFQCYLGAIYSLNCPPGLVFNEVGKYCDYRGNVELSPDIPCSV